MEDVTLQSEWFHPTETKSKDQNCIVFHVISLLLQAKWLPPPDWLKYAQKCYPFVSICKPSWVNQVFDARICCYLYFQNNESYGAVRIKESKQWTATSAFSQFCLPGRKCSRVGITTTVKCMIYAFPVYLSHTVVNEQLFGDHQFQFGGSITH